MKKFVALLFVLVAVLSAEAKPPVPSAGKQGADSRDKTIKSIMDYLVKYNFMP